MISFNTAVRFASVTRQWHAYLDEPTLADAILDRLVHNNYRLNLKGGSMRKHKALKNEPAARE